MCLLALAGCATTGAQSSSRINPLLAFQSKEARIFELGYRLATGNAAFCTAQQPTVGLLLHDVMAYGDPTAARVAFGLNGDIGVQAVASDSPADLAGLDANDTIVAIANVTIAQVPAGDALDWRRGKMIRQTLERAEMTGRVPVKWLEPDGTMRSAELRPTAACASVFELRSGDSEAAADGTRILVGADFEGFNLPDEQLAAVLAHEMAHNQLGHIPALIEHGRKDERSLGIEREADRLMPWLLANGGFDPRAATAMLRTLAPISDGSVLQTRTHDDRTQRIALVEAEIARLDQITDDGVVLADWRTYFRTTAPSE